MKYILDERILKIDVNSLYQETIQDFFDEYIPSKKIQHLLIQNKRIKLDGNPVKRESEITGLNLEILLYPEEYNYEKLENKPLDVVYEDEFVLVVNKPKDILVHSDGGNEITLTSMVQSYLCDKNYCSAIPIHRLDKETCGMVVFSKSIIFQPLFDKLLEEKKIRRNYLAFVSGRYDNTQSITINKPIGKDRHNANKRVIAKNGQEAITKVRSIKANKEYSILRCTLATGRTHQIRVHLVSIGYPILNDELYGRSSKLLKRMGLIADELSLYHPLKEEMLELEIDLPNDMNYLL